MKNKVNIYHLLVACIIVLMIWLNFFPVMPFLSAVPALFWLDAFLLALLGCLFLWQANKEKKHFIHSALKSSRDALFVVDHNGHIAEFSRSAEKLFGFDQQRVLQRPWDDVILPMSAREEYANAFMELVKLGKSELLQQVHRMTAIRHDGFTFAAEMVVHSVGLGNRPLFIFSVRDITELVEREMQIEDLKSIDPLTGVANRQKILHQFDYENDRFIRYESIFSALLLDIDNFSHINREFGLGKADKVLKLFAQTCREHLRSLDRIGRISGADFFIVLPETRIAEAKRVAEKIRNAVENKLFEVDGEEISITVSVGITCARLDNNTRKDMLQRLDKALQYAKSNGKNMAVVET